MGAKGKQRSIFLLFFAVLFLLLILVVPERIVADGGRSNEVLVAQNCGNGDTSVARSPTDIPYVISPRNTLLLSNQPKLRWNSLLDAKSYTVSLVKGDKTVWETTVGKNEVVYPGKPVLEAGVEYLLSVKADSGKSSAEVQESARGFRLLPTSVAQVVKVAIAQLNSQQIPQKVRGLASAYIYSGADLKSEAIETLEAMVAGGVKDVSVHHQLGNLYWLTGVSLLSEINYKEAVKLAKSSQDLPELAEISSALGRLYVAIGEKGEAVKWFSQARDVYKALGNTLRVRELNGQVDLMKRSLI